jgi:ubiquinone/menaquinone biosynthesis C-methylase UbiE
MRSRWEANLQRRFATAKPIYKVFLCKPTEAAYQLSQEEQNSLMAKVGDAEHIPLEDCSVDVAIAVTIGGGDIYKVAHEMERITKPEGLVIRIDVAPGWYGGELNPVITGCPRDESAQKGSWNEILPRLGYSVMDVFLHQDYGTVEKAIETYGFIHGKATIDHIRANRVTAIKWKMRVQIVSLSSVANLR